MGELSNVFGLVLRDIRVSKNLSQEALSFDAGLDRTYISLLERGLRQPSLSTLFSLANSLQVEPYQMIQNVQSLKDDICPQKQCSPLARRLREVRAAKDISQKQLGILIGIDPSSASPRINQYEQGKYLPDFRIAELLADSLGIPVTYLYAEDDQLAQMILVFTSLSKKQQNQALKAVQSEHSINI